MQVEIQHYDLCDDHKKCNDVTEKSKLDDSIRKIIAKEGYITCDVTKKTLPADGGNFLATLIEINIKGKAVDGEKEMALFVKIIGSDCEAMELLSVPEVYKTELFVYKELAKLFNELQHEANIPLHKRYNMVKCYEESYEMAIIMDNITKQGFKTGYRMDVVSISMAEESIKQLAKFHGLSFALESKKKTYFAKHIKPIKTPFKFGKAWNDCITKSFNTGLGYIDTYLSRKIEKQLPKLKKKWQEYLTDESSMYCLCHGDYRANNIMVKEVNGIITEVIPVDYQTIHYGCPVLDLIYFLYMGCDRQFRNKYTVYLKDLYYKSLDDFLQYFDLSAESVYPRKIFENLYEEKLDFGLILTFIIVPFVFLSENDEIPDITKEGIQHIDFRLDDRYKERLTDAVEEYIDLGYV